MASAWLPDRTHAEGAYCHTTTSKTKGSAPVVEGLLGQDRGQLKALLRESLQAVLEAEITRALGAASGARTDGRLVTGGSITNVG